MLGLRRTGVKHDGRSGAVGISTIADEGSTVQRFFFPVG